jgi:hypothetical protein
MAQFVDVGNFKANDQAVVTTNYIRDLLAAYPIQAPATRIDFIAEFLSVVAAHEVGHLAGCLHTRYDPDKPFSGKENLMDKVIQVPLGQDLIFGTADDIAMHFGTDNYTTLDAESFKGTDDTLNTFAFGLSTGKGANFTAVATASRISPLSLSRRSDEVLQ